VRDKLVETWNDPSGWWGWVITVQNGPIANRYAAAWPPPDAREPNLLLAALATLVLAPAAPALWFAERGIRRGRQADLRVGLAISFVSGLTFIVLAAAEALTLGHPDTAYASAVLVLLGFALIVVAIGLVMTAVVQIQAWLGYFTRLRYLAIQNLSLYWSFSAVTWLVVLVTVYVSPRLS
jgi:cytochrome c oxidase subunit I+III